MQLSIFTNTLIKAEEEEEEVSQVEEGETAPRP